MHVSISCIYHRGGARRKKCRLTCWRHRGEVEGRAKVWGGGEEGLNHNFEGICTQEWHTDSGR